MYTEDVELSGRDALLGKHINNQKTEFNYNQTELNYYKYYKFNINIKRLYRISNTLIKCLASIDALSITNEKFLATIVA